MIKKLIKGGGNSFCEAVKNMENKDLAVVPSKNKCEFVISSEGHSERVYFMTAKEFFGEDDAGGKSGTDTSVAR